MIEWIFFDLDGVLWNSELSHKNALEFALKEKISGYEIGSLENYWFFGESTLKIVSEMNEKKHLNLKVKIINEIIELKREKSIEFLKFSRPLNLDIIEKLLVLTKKTKIKKAIVSSSSKSNVQNFLEISGLKDHFEFTLDNSNVKKPKPHPEIYRTAISLANVNPALISAIEDSETGILSAKGAGIDKVFKYPFSTTDQNQIEKLVNQIVNN